MTESTRFEINRPDVVAQVRDAFERYEAALVANRVDELVEWFWDSPVTVRYGIDESHVGADSIAEYRRSQAVATPPRSLRGTVITTYGDDVATAVACCLASATCWTRSRWTIPGCASISC